MSENIQYTQGANRETVYREILPQIKSLIEGETDWIANMANICAVLKEALGFFWVGFYRVCDSQLVLAPFQGPLACTRINKGAGVCGTAWKEAKTIIVPDVEKFDGHIACSSLSRSEIVVPVFKDKMLVGVLDVDSTELNAFNDIDALYLQKVTDLIFANPQKNVSL